MWTRIDRVVTAIFPEQGLFLDNDLNSQRIKFNAYIRGDLSNLSSVGFFDFARYR